MSLRKQLIGYLTVALDTRIPLLGATGRQLGSDFESGLDGVRRRNRVGFWLVVVVLIALMVLQATTGLFAAGSRGGIDANGFHAIFGVGVGGLVMMLLRLAREATRADFVLVAIQELRRVDERQFVSLVAELARKWYGIGPGPTPARTPAASPG